jgi:hypothetical protein
MPLLETERVIITRGPSRLRRELGSVLALLAAAGGAFAFIRIASEVREGDTRAFDAAILLALRNPADHADPIGPTWLEIAMRDITSMGSTVVLAIIVAGAVGYLLIDGKRHAALLLAVAAVGGVALSAGIKLGFDRPRPDLVAHLVDVYDLSFPSGHAMMSAVVYLTIGALLARTSGRAADQGLCGRLRRRHDTPDRREPRVSWRALANRRAGRVVAGRGLGHGVLARRAVAAAARPGRSRRRA